MSEVEEYMTKADRKAILAIIKEEREEGTSGEDIAKRLNKEGYVTAHGNEWGAAHVSSFAINNGLPRQINTIAGAAGTTGVKHRPSVKKQKRKYQRSSKSVKRPEKTKGDMLNLMRDILTSNLSEDTQRVMLNKLIEI